MKRFFSLLTVFVIVLSLMAPLSALALDDDTVDLTFMFVFTSLYEFVHQHDQKHRD